MTESFIVLALSEIRPIFQMIHFFYKNKKIRFVFTFMFYLRYLCLLANSGVQCMLCYIFLRLLYPMLPVSLDWPLLIVPSVFSCVYLYLGCRLSIYCCPHWSVCASKLFYLYSLAIEWSSWLYSINQQWEEHNSFQLEFQHYDERLEIPNTNINAV